MLRILAITVLFFGLISFAFADEIGPAKPGDGTNETTTQSVETSDSETTCSWLDALLGKCEE